MPDSSESTLLEQFRQGEREAVGLLLDRVRPYIRIIVRTAQGDRGSPAADESDLIQDVVLQAVRSAKDFQGNSVGELVRWLRMMAIRTSRKAFAQRMAREPLSPDIQLDKEIADEQLNRPEMPVFQQENSAQMAAALNRLPEEMREVLLFRLVDGLGHNQIADRMDRSPGAVRMLFLRAVERLREECGKSEAWWWK